MPDPQTPPEEAGPAPSAIDEVEPLDVDGVTAVAWGTALWGVAFVVTLLLRDRLASSGNEWWIWVCLSAFLGGLVGLWYVRRRAAVYRGAASRGPTAAGGS